MRTTKSWTARRGTIGKFGVGLKDALATLHRRGVHVVITSARGRYELREAAKHGFDVITTLHVSYTPPPPGTVVAGTDVALNGVTPDQITAAKNLFLKFANEHVVEATQHGEILARGDREPRVYISGVLAATEPNFLFSYNITSLTDAMRKRLNRERLNVGPNNVRGSDQDDPSERSSLRKSAAPLPNRWQRVLGANSAMSSLGSSSPSERSICSTSGHESRL